MSNPFEFSEETISSECANKWETAYNSYLDYEDAVEALEVEDHFDLLPEAREMLKDARSLCKRLDCQVTGQTGNLVR